MEEATGEVADPKYASEVASAKDTDDFEARARWFEADSGFMRFLTLNDRGFLTLMGITGNRRGKPGFPTGFANTREEHRVARYHPLVSLRSLVDRFRELCCLRSLVLASSQTRV